MHEHERRRKAPFVVFHPALFRRLHFVDFISSTSFRRLHFVDFLSTTDLVRDFHRFENGFGR